MISLATRGMLHPRRGKTVYVTGEIAVAIAQLETACAVVTPEVTVCVELPEAACAVTLENVDCNVIDVIVTEEVVSDAGC